MQKPFQRPLLWTENFTERVPQKLLILVEQSLRGCLSNSKSRQQREILIRPHFACLLLSRRFAYSADPGINHLVTIWTWTSGQMHRVNWGRGTNQKKKKKKEEGECCFNYRQVRGGIGDGHLHGSFPNDPMIDVQPSLNHRGCYCAMYRFPTLRFTLSEGND